MINAINALIMCVTTGLFTAAFLVIALRLGWFPVMIVQYMTPEEAEEIARQKEEHSDE